MEFKKYKIEEIGTVVGGGTPSTKNDNYYGGNISWITPKDLSNYSNRYIYHGERNITEEGLNNSSAKLVPTDTILMTSRAPIGYLALAGKKVATNQGFKSIICNEEIVSPKYLYYLLQNKMDNIKSLGTGSTFSEISGKVVKNIEVSLPNLLNQKRVEKVLDSIDEKIELNQKIIANLEELSQTLFKRWFVDFEFPDENGNPYKSSGGEMIDSELGEMPLSWKVHKLNDIFKINYGKNLPTKKILNTGYPVFGGNGIIGYYSSYMYENPKILISCRGAASGKIHISKEKSFVTNNSIVLNEKQKNYFYYFKELFKYNDFKRYTTGSAQPQITIANIKDLMYLTPDTNIIDQFNSKISSLFNQKNNYEDENQNLTQLRDTLLPKLMSGEIEIPDDIEVNEDELSI
ncbi:restriction endonuclease subunit S [Staphylococcus epidermidis]|uniref:Restriction modification system DNA specificity domain-containing protein n=1 Tax=Staphylococcus epidermidis TaxID=1282 RepID=A0A169T0P8_STAEP|nr:restriction endonuclease subunit S [Staphylococcus epidermidis]BAU98225.1 restriction modification system DNA specificity domain-containing protein [Staphylococcus epidermidis]